MLKCEYCDKNAKYIWWNKESFYHIGNKKRPILYPLCEDHGSNMFPRIKILEVETDVQTNTRRKSKL